MTVTLVCESKEDNRRRKKVYYESPAKKFDLYSALLLMD